MKIALIGYGKMGKMVEQSAIARGHSIIAIINSTSRFDKIKDADVLIDFSHPEVALQNIRKACSYGKNLVMGTTGWYDYIEDVKREVESSGIGLLYAANFSIGVNLFMQIVANAATLIDEFSQYDVGAFESHHREKVDQPSGTAKVLTDILTSKMLSRKKKIGFQSVRCGWDPGTHTVFFDSPSDRISLTHNARDRRAFSDGSVLAAEWLQNKSGFYTIMDMLNGGEL